MLQKNIGFSEFLIKKKKKNWLFLGKFSFLRIKSARRIGKVEYIYKFMLAIRGYGGRFCKINWKDGSKS